MFESKSGNKDQLEKEKTDSKCFSRGISQHLTKFQKSLGAKVTSTDSAYDMGIPKMYIHVGKSIAKKKKIWEKVGNRINPNP